MPFAGQRIFDPRDLRGISILDPCQNNRVVLTALEDDYMADPNFRHWRNEMRQNVGVRQ